MENTCSCLRSINDGGDIIYVCMNYKCHKSENEKWDCIVTETKSNKCAFLKNGKCDKYTGMSTCRLATSTKCSMYKTKQDNWREMLRADDEMNTDRPSWSDYSKPHINGKVTRMSLTELEKDKKYEIVIYLKKNKKVTTVYAPSVARMSEFYNNVINQRVWYEDHQLEIIQEDYFEMEEKDIEGLLECLRW